MRDEFSRRLHVGTIAMIRLSLYTLAISIMSAFYLQQIGVWCALVCVISLVDLALWRGYPISRFPQPVIPFAVFVSISFAPIIYPLVLLWYSILSFKEMIDE